MISRLVFTQVVAAVCCVALPDCDTLAAERETATEAPGTASSFQLSSDGNDDMTTDNPLFIESPLDYRYPQFDRILDAHYAPAFERGMAEQLEQVRTIAASGEAPSFDNTIVALERSGRLLARVSNVFFAIANTDINDTLDALRSEIAPRLAAHQDAISLDGALFSRIETLHQQRASLGLDPESQRLLERYYTDYVRAGAELSDAEKEILKRLNAELASLQARFSQNVLNEVNNAAVLVETREALSGLSDSAIAAASEAAAGRDEQGKYLITLHNTTGQPVLESLDERELRHRIFAASAHRNSRGGDYDNRETVARIARLRAERAALLGYPNHAAYQLEDATAGSPEAVNARLGELAPLAVRNARAEALDLQGAIDAEGGGFELAAWDWARYAERVRTERYAVDDAQLKPYFELRSVLENGVFYAAERLYGLSFKQRTDLPVYSPDVRVFEVFDADGEALALFTFDAYARASKRGGAWMSAWVDQSRLLGTRAVVANNLNIAKPPAGQPTLLTFDEVITLFHEFGHALHGIFSNVEYPRFSGTEVPPDFVEYPSQVNEMWAIWPQVLANYARHYQTGEPIPQALLEKIVALARFNQGFATTEYLAAAILDQAWHQRAAAELPDADGVLDFEAAALKAAGIDYAAVPPRYRTAYFSHIWESGYAAGYYSYIWAEVLDADTVEWFKENGGLKRENGDRFRTMLLSRGGSEDAMRLYRDFRGRDAEIGPLLERRGLN